MSKLFKSKFFLGVMVMTVMLVGVVAFTAGTQSAAAATTTTSVTTITHTLKVGSTYKAEVKILQAGLGLTADGSFGPKTKAAVIAWQKKEGLTADGIFGAKSLAMFNGGAVTTTLPAGCTSTAGFSATTGQNCSTGATTTTTTTLPAGCVTTSGFSSTTGVSCSTGVSVTTSGPLSVALSQDNPAAGYVISNQATADMMNFTVTGSGVLNSVTLVRTGISDQNTLSNVYLYNGNTRLTDGYSFNNSSVLTMNNLGININGSLEIAVKADISSDAGNTASTVGISLTGLTAGTTATTANVAGNLMYLGTGSPATVYVNPANQTVTLASVNAGTSGYTVWSNSIQVNTRAVLLKGANFRMVGSAPAGALANIKLYVDGVQAGSVATVGTINGSNYAMFDFSGSPVSLSTGSHVIDVRADIVGGSSYTVQVSLQQAADLVVYDPQLNINIAASNGLNCSSTAGCSAFTSSSAGTLTINAGTASVVVDPTFSSLTNITGGSTNAVIGKFQVYGYGEDVKVTSLTVIPTLGSACTTGSSYSTGSGTLTGDCTHSLGYPTGNGLNNVAVFFDGSQVGSSQNWTTGGSLTFNLGSQMIIPASVTSTIEIHADLQDQNSINYTAGTVSVQLGTIAITNNAQGQTSHTTLNFPGNTTAGSYITTSGLTIQNGLLAVSQNGSYSSANSANPNTAGVKIGSFTLQNQSSSEAVRITSLVVGLPAAGATVVGGTTTGTNSLTNLSNLRTMDEASNTTTTPVQPASTNTFSVNLTLAPGATDTIDILADTSTAATGSVQTTLTVTGIGATSNVSVLQNSNGTAVGGQVVSLSAGTLTNPVTLLTASATSSQYIASANGAASATKATFNFASTNGTSTINELKFTTAVGTATSVTVNGVSAPFVNGVAYLTGLTLAVPNGQGGLNQDVYVSYPTVGTNGLISGTVSQLSLTYVKYQSGGKSTTLYVGGPTGSVLTQVSAPIMVLVGSSPTVTAVKPATSLSQGGVVEAVDVTVSANTAGNIALNTLPITVSGSGTNFLLGSAPSVVVQDASGTTVATVTAATTATAGNFDGTTSHGSAIITFTNGYTIQAGQSQTFKIFVPVTSYSSSGVNTVSMTTTLPTTNMTWTDLAGNGGAGALGAVGALSSSLSGVTLINGYPNTFSSVIYN